MAKAKKSAKKKPAKKTAKAKGGIAGYVRKINNTPAVKAVTKRIKKAEMVLKKQKALKKKAVKAAQKKYKSKSK
jgi:hypothetical protein